MAMNKNTEITREEAFKPEERFKNGKRKINHTTVDDNNIHTRLAHHLRVARIERGISQSDAADKYSVGRAGCPLPPPPRHSGAVKFLKAVEAIQRERESNDVQLSFWF